ncbi:MAG: sodium-translocating pyrophosphatase [Anaerolineaceae bacterium]|nr:sodium-translocating pyrophosphatase [Anaerolineaceae bacterium]
MTTWLIISLVAGLVSVGIAFYLYFWVIKQEVGTERAEKVAGWIQTGAKAYLRKLYSALGLLAVVMGIIIALVFGLDIEGGFANPDLGRGLQMAFYFVIGSVLSAGAGYMGMVVAVHANVRTATAANESLSKAFNLSFRAGSVMGLSTVGIAILGMSTIYLITNDPNYVLGFSLGASMLALLAKAGGGIYTKTADIAADLVGKIEAGIPEDDPRNPAVVADNVGDNVGDVAGMGADIFDSYVASVVAAMLLGFSLPAGEEQIIYTAFPLIVCALGILASVIGMFFVKVEEGGRPGKALNTGTIVTSVLLAVFVAIVVLVGGFNMGVMWATIGGIVTGIIIGFTSDYYTNDVKHPVQYTSKVSTSGSAINIITGISYGFLSVVPSILGIAAATLISYFVAQAYGLPGVYGVGIAAVGLLSISGMIVSSDAYGPIVDNARGIAEMAGMDEEVIRKTDILDSAGNTAKAITKGFAISAAAMTVLALFAAYSELIAIATGTQLVISLRDPLVIAGAMIGTAAPPFFSALLMLSVTHNAFDMIEEIRKQWADEPRILKGEVEPDYEKCVELASQDAIGALIGPGLIAVALPLAVGFIMGPEALGGFLGGSILTGIVFALFMSNAGGLWDNAKKFIESGHFGGKGSEAHKAGVVGDTVGDPFKDTAGPSINTLITVMSLVASTFAPVIGAFSIFG